MADHKGPGPQHNACREAQLGCFTLSKKRSMRCLAHGRPMRAHRIRYVAALGVIPRGHRWSVLWPEETPYGASPIDNCGERKSGVCYWLGGDFIVEVPNERAGLPSPRGREGSDRVPGHGYAISGKHGDPSLKKTWYRHSVQIGTVPNPPPFLFIPVLRGEK